jgi:hypothetical protein
MVESGSIDDEGKCTTKGGGGEVVWLRHSRALEGAFPECRSRHMPKSVAPTVKIPKASTIWITSIAIRRSLQQNITRFFTGL